MPVIIFSEIRHFGTDESRQTAKLSGIVTDEGKRTFPFYLSDTIRRQTTVCLLMVVSFYAENAGFRL